MPILQRTFQRKVKRALDEMGVSQSELARRMGTDRQYVYKYIAGITCPGLDVIERFANALEIAPVALLDDSEICSAVG